VYFILAVIQGMIEKSLPIVPREAPDLLMIHQQKSGDIVVHILTIKLNLYRDLTELCTSSVSERRVLRTIFGCIKLQKGFCKNAGSTDSNPARYRKLRAQQARWLEKVETDIRLLNRKN
jgi:hypothetical protein